MADRLILSIVGRNAIGCEGLRRILLDNGFELGRCVTYNQKLDFQDWNDSSSHVVVVDGGSVNQALEVSAQVRAELAHARVVILCDAFDLNSIRRAFAMNIDGVLPAEMRPAALAVAIRLIALGEKAMPSELPELLLAEYGHFIALPQNLDAPSIKLSDGEQDILRLVASGQTNRAIGEALGLTEAAVKVQIKAILRKLHVGNRTQAATWAYCHGLANEGGNGAVSH